MDAALITALNGAYDEGRGGAEGIARTMKLAGMLGMQKEALNLPPGVMGALGKLAPSPTTRNAVVTGLVTSGTLAAAGLGVRAVSSGARALNERFSKKKDLEKILETFPRLKEYSPAEIELAYNSIRHMNPHIAADPLAGGSLLGQVLRQRDSLDPKTMRMDVDLAGNLLRLRPEDQHIGEEIVRDAVSTGMAMGFQEAAKTRDRTQAEQFQRGENYTKRVFDASQRDEDRAAQKKELGARYRQAVLDRKEMSGIKAQERADKQRENRDRQRMELLKMRFAQSEGLKGHARQDQREGIKAMLNNAEVDQMTPANTLNTIFNNHPHLRP